MIKIIHNFQKNFCIFVNLPTKTIMKPSWRGLLSHLKFLIIRNPE
jgi:hypothetical protein